MSYPESNEQFNRQQGEELIAALTGEEAPDLGYPATNEQFNREQGNRLIEAVKIFSPSGGLPDPSSLTDGTAMVAVNGEWKKQEGYGYSAEVEEEILSEIEVETVAAPGYPVALADIPAINIIDGDEYHVIFDGAEYFLHAASMTVEDEETTYLGEVIDSNIVFDNFPFYVTIYESFYTSQENAGVHTISIYHVTSTSHSIDHTLMPKGYGYYGEPAFEPITWDGDTEGRDTVDMTALGGGLMYKVSSTIIEKSAFDGGEFVYAESGVEYEHPIDMDSFMPTDELLIYAGEIIAFLVAEAGTYTIFDGFEITVPSSGVYFYYTADGYVTSLTAPSTVHQFDPALIPASGGEEFVVKFEQGDDGVVADATWEDVTMAVNSGKLPKGIFYNEGKPYYEFQYAGGVFINMTLVANNTLMIMTIGSDGTSAWAFNVANYTLTPTT